MTDDETIKAATERRKLMGMLQSLYELSEHSTLSGAFKKGADDATGHYNRIVARLTTLGEITPELFPPLDPELATFHQIGVAAKLLLGWLRSDDEPQKSHNLGFHLDLDGLSHLGDIGRKIRDELNFEKTVRVTVDTDEKNREA
jgi:hypothetical protein